MFFGNCLIFDLPFCPLATQGAINAGVEKNLVKNYKIATSSDGFDFITYQENNTSRIFSGDLDFHRTLNVSIEVFERKVAHRCRGFLLMSFFRCKSVKMATLWLSSIGELPYNLLTMLSIRIVLSNMVVTAMSSGTNCEQSCVIDHELHSKPSLLQCNLIVSGPSIILGDCIELGTSNSKLLLEFQTLEIFILWELATPSAVALKTKV